MEPNKASLIDLMADAAREGREIVGSPCRAVFLFSNRASLIMDVAKDPGFPVSVVHQVAGDQGVPWAPFVVAMVGPFGVWSKVIDESGSDESPPDPRGIGGLFLVPPPEKPGDAM